MPNDVLYFLLGFVIGTVVGAVNIWFLIRSYRKSLGFKPSPFEPENIYMM